MAAMSTSFDWLEFLRDNSVSYRTSGPSVVAGNVAVKCPFCGEDDPSEHMSINLDGHGWRCWRRPDAHKGRSPVKLVQALIKCTWDQAAAIVGTRRASAEAVTARVQALLTPAPSVHQHPTPLELPKSFKLIDRRRPSCAPYINYLKRRGYDSAEIDVLAERYSLHYCTSGAFHGRVIFPVTFEGRLVSWTGRTIHSDVDLRYKALSSDPERAKREDTPVAVGGISHYLLWYDELMHSEANTLYLTEGPFDALNLNRLADCVTATCFFTAAPTAAQVALLHTLAPRFERTVLLLDRGTTPLAMQITSALRTLSIRPVTLPPRYKDPAELDQQAFFDLARKVESRYEG